VTRKVSEQEGARRRASRRWRVSAQPRPSRSFLGALTFVGDPTVGFGRLATLRARFRRSDLLLFVQECGA
jgi:hypothetical protein